MLQQGYILAKSGDEDKINIIHAKKALLLKGTCMKHVSLMALSLCLLSCTYAEKPKESRKPVKVFLLAGQSNMEGQGVVSMDHPQHYNSGKGNLVNTMKDPNKAHLYKHLKNERGEWVVRDDVKITFRDRSGGLTIGYTGYGGSSHIGPELQFGHVVGDYYAGPVLLIKTLIVYWEFGKSRDFSEFTVTLKELPSIQLVISIE